MTDTNKLKELAEKLAPAYQQPWESHRHSASAVTVGAVGEDGEYSDFIDVRISDYSAFDEHDDELGQWIAAANPQAILGLIDEVERLEEELSQCASALPGTEYMDPPDGGNVSIPEQIRRMAKDAARYRGLRDEGYLHNWASLHVCDEHLRAQRTDEAIDSVLNIGATQ
ncbi:TPA: hypothetical protein L4885_006255 [Pseudomonas aeruginosa]|uniref:hypothetical protein n=1 Tax=Pseudomonas aeruginosa TaxID=287 RepID=UPI00068D0584|nr:hypothetical protein [Pseudomonas aeruginosa]MBY9358220.1 hypothetical protein [Pseudomonas aeruginosa]MBY9465628.1 hypothetical protein [Pseudomonas aeruginosa]MBY9541850.1 hypothetical protein [Pseudomonas aeruginosa]MBY9555712.1 hypothetical protein [Pseudomonas aeruginosa]MBY9568019.1 hypothetical protein [Pseudomonas aeruginosa]